jgi:hypothetical protein
MYTGAPAVLKTEPVRVFAYTLNGFEQFRDLHHQIRMRVSFTFLLSAVDSWYRRLIVGSQWR